MLGRAVDSPLVRGGLTIGAGIIAGNVIGFFRVALTAYLLGTHSLADSLAVALGPLDTFNSVIINSMVFAFVPLLAKQEGAARTALFLALHRRFSILFAIATASILAFAPWLIRVLAPGLDPAYFPAAVTNLRIISLSTLAAGMVSVHSALLYTDRRFAPTAFYQASLNLGTVAGALALAPVMGVHGFALGYTLGAWVQSGVVWWAARSRLELRGVPASTVGWRDLLAKPLSIAIFTGGLAANITFTRAWGTHYGPGAAAALDYCMRGVGVPLALLVSPMSNALLPEIARLRSQFRLPEAFRLIDRTIALAALAAVGGCGAALALREPAIRLLFERGSFTPESTRMVAAVFLGLGPSMIGWSLMELTSRSLFSLGRARLPMMVAFLPLAVNVAVTLWLGAPGPQFIGLGASLGLLAGFVVLFGLARAGRRKWLARMDGGAGVG